MLLHDARRATRTDDEGAIVLLEDQDRSRWDSAKIAAGSALVEQALRGRPPGPYAVQAAIAALHAQAPSARETDWPQIAALYSVLVRLHPSPVVKLNRAVAIAMADGTSTALPCWTPSICPAITCCRPRAQTCCVAWAVAPKRPQPTGKHWRWSQTLPSGNFFERRLAEVSLPTW